MKNLYFLILAFALLTCQQAEVPDRPNVILIMSDDLGWGDTGFNGNEVVKTPNLDMLASKGMIFNRFYSASPVCSPTRASCLTGRNPYRMNIVTANSGFMKTAEVTLAEVLRRYGYQTGHFGKWHLGTMTTKIKDSNRGRPGNFQEFSIPSQHGFHEFFSTEAKVPTFDPMIKPSVYDEKIGESPRYGWLSRVGSDSIELFGTYYWDGKEKRVREAIQGDDSKIIMDRAIDFITTSSMAGEPFFAVIWFHTPHLPVVADPRHRDLYPGMDVKEQLYYGTISAMDDQVGKLWETLSILEEDKNTMLWFCSDNGPENGTPGSSGPFRERKRSLYEGGVRVPAFVVWENEIAPNQKTDFPAVTSDYMPSIIDMISLKHYLARPFDGVSLKGAIEGSADRRKKPIGFLFRDRMSWVTQQHKLISVDEGKTFELYDLLNDPQEQSDILQANQDLATKLRADLAEWMSSVNDSRTGGDY